MDGEFVKIVEDVDSIENIENYSGDNELGVSKDGINSNTNNTIESDAVNNISGNDLVLKWWKLNFKNKLS